MTQIKELAVEPDELSSHSKNKMIEDWVLPADPHTNAVTQQPSPSVIQLYTSVDPACSSYILDNIILTAVEEMINTTGGDSQVPCYTV